MYIGAEKFNISHFYNIDPGESNFERVPLPISMAVAARVVLFGGIGDPPENETKQK
jgi:hypothetical protein